MSLVYISLILSIVSLSLVVYLILRETPTSSIKTESIQESAVTNVLIADEAVTTEKLSDTSVTTKKIVDKSVTGDKLADSSVTSDKLDPSAIIIADGSVTSDKIADGAITSAKLEQDGDFVMTGSLEVSKLAVYTNNFLTIANQATAVLTEDGYPSGSTIEISWTGLTGVTTVTLPKCQIGYHLDIFLHNVVSGGEDLIINTNASDSYSATSLISQPVNKSATTVAGTKNRLTINGDATVARCSLGSLFEFVGVDDDVWRVRGLCVPIILYTFLLIKLWDVG